MELKFVSFVLKRVVFIFCNFFFKFCIENKVVVFIIDFGSIKLYLNVVVVEVSLCFSFVYVIRLLMEWIFFILNRKLIVVVRLLIMVIGMFLMFIFMKWIFFISYVNIKLFRFYLN